MTILQEKHVGYLKPFHHHSLHFSFCCSTHLYAYKALATPIFNDTREHSILPCNPCSFPRIASNIQVVFLERPVYVLDSQSHWGPGDVDNDRGSRERSPSRRDLGNYTPQCAWCTVGAFKLRSVGADVIVLDCRLPSSIYQHFLHGHFQYTLFK